jgi:hypothetical protein
MVHASQRCGDSVNYNGPKVDTAPTCWGSAPRRSNATECSWLFAGNPEHPAVLEKLSSDNPTGADNQQERPIDDH